MARLGCVGASWNRGSERIMAPYLRAFGLAAMAVFALFAGGLGGCANNENPETALADGKGPITPGTKRDFSVNVGDLVYFSSDSSDLTPESQTTLQKQVRW